MDNIGFIGLGIMGRPMAKNLIQAGYPLKVYNRSPGPCRECEDMGAEAAKSSAHAAEGMDVVITVLPDSPDVEKVVLGPEGAARGMVPGSVLIDMSSISPQVTRKVAYELSNRGVHMLDAPVSGGEKGAIEATLSIMVGGDEQVFERCLPILEVMGSSVVRIGEIGSGNYAKLANQIIVALNIAALSEAVVLAQKAGLDPEILCKAIGHGTAGSRIMEVKAPKMMERNFKPGFKIHLHGKDLKNALEAAHELQVSLPLSGIMQQIFSALLEQGHGQSDHSAVITFYEKLAGGQVSRQGAGRGSDKNVPL